MVKSTECRICLNVFGNLTPSGVALFLAEHRDAATAAWAKRMCPDHQVEVAAEVLKREDAR